MNALTDAQQAALDEIVARIDAGVPHSSLQGFAGSGKTFVAGRLAAQWSERQKVFLCAPTHKATQVLRSMTDAEASVQTIHALLGLRLVPDGEGGYVLEHERDHKRPERGLVIVDEASMIGKAEWKHIQQTGGLQWLFVGDPAQLPPVNEERSPALGVAGPLLEQIVRQEEEHPILDLATQVRQGERGPFRTRFAEGEGVAVTRNQEGFFESAARAFDSDAFRDDASHARLLAYRNRTVRRYNDRIRAELHGADAERFVKGEWLVGRETWFDEGQAMIFNSEEVQVVAVQESLVETEDLQEWRVHEVLVERPWNGKLASVHVLHEEEEERFQEELKRRKDRAIDRARHWDSYYALRERFARVDYAYAMTVHKAQGSTFDTAFVDLRDLQSCRGEERPALMYVAVTRPSRRLALLV